MLQYTTVLGLYNFIIVIHPTYKAITSTATARHSVWEEPHLKYLRSDQSQPFPLGQFDRLNIENIATRFCPG